MSPLKSPGRSAGQLLSEAGQELVGRPVDIAWEPFRPHNSGVEKAPPAVLDALTPEARERAGDEEWIAWRPCFDNYCDCWQPPDTEGMLDRLLALEDAEPSEIERFIFDYGAIAGCVHLSAHDNCDQLLSTRGLDDQDDHPLSWVRWDAPAAYREYARSFHRILTLAAAIRYEEEVATSEWVALIADADRRWSTENVDEWFTDTIGTFDAHDVQAAGIDFTPSPDRLQLATQVLTAVIESDLLGAVVHAFMSESPVVVGFEWPVAAVGERQQGPRLGLTGDTFGILAYQLAIAIQGDLFAICSNCHRTYAPRRRPAKGRDNYCFACRDARKVAYKSRKRSEVGA